MFFSILDRATDIKLSRFQKIKISDMPVNRPGSLPDAERLSRYEFLTACLMRGELPGQVLSQYDKLAYQLRQPDNNPDRKESDIYLPYAQNFVTHMAELEQFGDLTSVNLSFDLLKLLFQITDDYWNLNGFLSLDYVCRGIKPGKLIVDRFWDISSDWIRSVHTFAEATNQFIQQTGADVFVINDFDEFDYVTTEKYLLTSDCLYYYRSMSINPNVNHVTHMLLLMYAGKSIHAEWVRDKIGFWNPVKGFAYEFSLSNLTKDDWDDIQTDWNTWQEARDF